MVRVIFNPARTDGYSYDVNGLVLASGAIDGATNEYSYTNQARTQMNMKINLRSILGSKEFDSKKLFCIKLNDVESVNERDANLIDHTSPSWIRTSNIVIYGPNFLGSANEIIMGQATNFNPNDEARYELIFHRGDQTANRLAFLNLINQGNIGSDISQFISNVHPYRDNLPCIRNQKWRWNNYVTNPTEEGWDTVPSLENVEFIVNVLSTNTMQGTTYSIDVVVDGRAPSLYLRPGGLTGIANKAILLTQIPDNPTQWTMAKRDDNLANDYGYGIEAWFHKPGNDYVDITLELRDLLQNKLQPVMAIPNGRVVPPFTFVFDIY